MTKHFTGNGQNILMTKYISCDFMLSLLRFTLICGYIGLSLNSAQLSADPYVSTFISGAVEVPAYICVWLVLRYFPRRPSTICMILLGGVSLFFIQLVSQSKKTEIQPIMSHVSPFIHSPMNEWMNEWMSFYCHEGNMSGVQKNKAWKTKMGCT